MGLRVYTKVWGVYTGSTPKFGVYTKVWGVYTKVWGQPYFDGWLFGLN